MCHVKNNKKILNLTYKGEFMNQEKIGKFIQERRKAKKLTQEEQQKKLELITEVFRDGKMVNVCQIYLF